MSKKDFLAITDLPRHELLELMELAVRMKRGEYREQPLSGQTLGLIFAKSSTRTRVSFEVGMYQLGGHALFLSSRDIQLGRGEPIRDTARVLSRMVNGIMIRTFDHTDVEELAQYATIPVINGLTDLLHPCQLLADLSTMYETFGSLDGLTCAWVGDGNNMANSWLNAAAVCGLDLRLACPDDYHPDPEIVAYAEYHTNVTITSDPKEAVEGAHVVNTDVWTSMGQEEETRAREQAFAGYCIDESMMNLAADNAIFLHCLPAHRGEEVTDGVIEGAQSRVFDQAEYRLHAQKALLVRLMASQGTQ